MPSPTFNSSLISPPIEQLLDKVDSKFSLVTLAARRARQINAYLSHLGGNLGSIVPPQLDSFSKKPLSIAFDEIAAGLVVPIREEAPSDESSPEDADFDLDADLDLGDDLSLEETPLINPTPGDGETLD